MVEQQDSDSPEYFGGWEQSGSCYHCLNGGRKNKAHINVNHEVSSTIQQLFEMFFKDFIVGMTVLATCQHLQAEKQHLMTYGEFLHWVGLWFLMGTVNGTEQSEFWSLGEVDCFVGAPMRLGAFVSFK